MADATQQRETGFPIGQGHQNTLVPFTDNHIRILISQAVSQIDYFRMDFNAITCRNSVAPSMATVHLRRFYPQSCFYEFNLSQVLY